MNAIQAFVPPDVVKTFAAFLEFCYIARRNVITDDSLEQLNVALHQFHKFRQVFLGTARGDSPSAFSLPRQHSMVHYYEHIKNFGSPNGLCSSITESKHIVAVKRPWRRSNKHAALPQMLKVNERLDKLAAARADFTARGMLEDSCLVNAIRNALGNDSEDPTDEDASNSDETDSDFSSDLNHTRTYGPADTDTLNNANTNALDNVNTDTLDDADTDMLDDADTNTLDDADTDALDDADTDAPDDAPDDADADALNDTGTHASGVNDSLPPTPHRRSPTPPDGEEGDDHGPVESGPLMNEVRLVSKKGQKPLPVMRRL